MKKKLLGRRAFAAALAATVMATAMPYGSIPAVAAEEMSNETVNLLSIGNWDFWTGEGGAGSMSEIEGGADVSVTAAGGQLYAIQYTHALEMVVGETYQISMDFLCPEDAIVHLNLQETGSWSSILPEDKQVIHLKANEVYHYTATTAAATSNFVSNGKLAIMFGAESQNVGKTISVTNAKIMGLTSHQETGTEEEQDGNTGSDVVVDAPSINLKAADTELYVGSDWAGANAVVTEDGAKAVINAANFGWNGEWAIQYMIHSLGLRDQTEYTVAADLTSTVDKKVLIKLDDSGMIVDTVSLKAGQTYHYVKTITSGTFANQTLYFALGQMSGEDANRAGTVTIENVKIAGEKDQQEITTPDSDSEYNFADTENNRINDYADPGIEKEGYELIWGDEFDGNYGNDTVDRATGLNLDKWAYQLGDGTTDCGNYGWGNNELQCYTKDSKNIAVNEDLTGDGQADGLLRITASYEDNGIVYAGESAKKYSSARIRTTSPSGELFNTTYGYVEARISLPQTKGAWPAFWMLPESTSIYGGWPVSGEIDILETTGTHADEVCGTLHWGTPNHVYKGSGYVGLDSDVRFFHTYAIDWKPGQIDWIYDGKVIYTSTEWASGISGASDSLSFDAPFDQPFYAILNLAVDSGNFGGAANRAAFGGNINMYVDYVRCFQKTQGYPKSAKQTVDKNAKTDWEAYSGRNMIGEIAEDTLVGTGGGLNDVATDADKWYLSNQDDAAGAGLQAYTDADGKTWAKVNIAKAGGQDYSNQLIGHFNAMKGYTYKVSFDAYAAGDMVGKTVNCDAKEYAGWSTYAVSNVKLNSTPSSYAFAWNQGENFENCRIEFNLGAQGTGEVYISNVKVEIIDPATIEDVSGGRQVLAGGELLYNSTFDQGNDHFGYWTAADGTTVVIPRYTTEDLTGNDVSVIDVASKSNYEAIADGKKYYERRAQISADENTPAQIYQTGFAMGADDYAASFDLYAKEDTAVKVSVFATKETEDGFVLDREVLSKVYRYRAEDGVKNYKFAFTTDTDLANAAIVYTFAKNVDVQFDNAHLVGAHQGVQADENPLNENTTWTGDDGNGNTISLIIDNGTVTMKNILSGANWYAWQLPSSNFTVGAGYTYRFAFDYKMTGNTNRTFQYIIQEAGGSWAVVRDVETVTYDADNADAAGFNHYEVTFTSAVTLDNCHVVFGFGNSAADGRDNAFTFKNADIRLVNMADETSGDDTEDDSAEVDPSVFVPVNAETPADEDDHNDGQNQDDQNQDDQNQDDQNQDDQNQDDQNDDGQNHDKKDHDKKDHDKKDHDKKDHDKKDKDKKNQDKKDKDKKNKRAGAGDPEAVVAHNDVAENANADSNSEPEAVQGSDDENVTTEIEAGQAPAAGQDADQAVEQNGVNPVMLWTLLGLAVIALIAGATGAVLKFRSKK
ncbi:MAG: glycoside hydrolase family 16 protein [Agathobacter sp.]|uniref:glycoside hydrolase family 16 protein n=1 Tax=Agathobacter sp. TaxID=2021311 RepID=UPI00258A8580|nr:glycoside hydrolase family 16 protein [Agathobacter sp.]MCR5677810.1 glycoside hydrolase family 16 protein [Agathobacter sp.]